jgi:hypothetical protein
LCLQSGILPVFITQPALAGDGTSASGNPNIDFHCFADRERAQLFWLKLRLYNDTMEEIAVAKDIPCINLANEMSKDTCYYYDLIHFTNKGSQKVADIIFKGLKYYLAVKYHYLKR